MWLPSAAKNVAGDRLLDFLAGHWTKGLQDSQRVGVLFLDRLRLQPAGMVIGEPLYKLS